MVPPLAETPVVNAAPACPRPDAGRYLPEYHSPTACATNAPCAHRNRARQMLCTGHSAQTGACSSIGSRVFGACSTAAAFCPIQAGRVAVINCSGCHPVVRAQSSVQFVASKTGRPYQSHLGRGANRPCSKVRRAHVTSNACQHGPAQATYRPHVLLASGPSGEGADQIKRSFDHGFHHRQISATTFARQTTFSVVNTAVALRIGIARGRHQISRSVSRSR